MKGVKKITKEEYVSEVRGMATFIGNQGAKIAQVSRHLTTTADFSPTTAREIDDILEHMKNLVGCLKKVKALTIQRGVNHYEEEKERLTADMDAKMKALVEGTLRLNRRNNDMAAE